MKELYLGDGVYATFDGCDIALDLRAQEPTPNNRIALEPAVFDRLLKFAADCGVIVKQ